MIVNGKEYPMWSQFVERKDEWIGGELIDYHDPRSVSLGAVPIRTKITDISLKPNGDKSAFFSVEGKDFTCGFDVRVGGISTGGKDDGSITFSGYGGHRWCISSPDGRDQAVAESYGNVTHGG